MPIDFRVGNRIWQENKMRSLKYLALIAIIMFAAAAPSHAQVVVGIGVGPGYGYAGPAPERLESESKLREIGLNAVRRHFSPEFVNRIDSIVAYQPLDAPALEEILDQQLRRLQRHLIERMSVRSFTLEVDEGARALLLRQGVSQEYGARELKRTIHRRILQPLAGLVAANKIPALGFLRVTVSDDGESLELKPEPPRMRNPRREPVRPPLAD